MKVEKIMTSDVGVCQVNESLAEAAGIMWQKDCGVVPIVDENNQAIGMITDRDVCIAVTSQNRPASEILTGELINGKPITCSLSDSAKDALKKMRKYKIKRLPVVDEKCELAGILSIADFLRIKKNKSFKKQLLKTLETISKPEAIFLKEV